MIRVDRIEDLENCLDSSAVKEVFFDRGVDETTMRCAAHQGRLQYFPNFPKPYFRIERDRVWVIQGVIGNLSLRVTLSPSAPDNAVDEFVDLVEGRMEPEEKLK